ncbi:MAG: gliding motility-associated ABC transporter ATP-binding subunit GldA [Saprospiraceae bacterium]|nr:MAG: gliding motility-associated ABC transporter ATP-binding subunit GldA [Bacteroidetes bacterium OLB9]MCO6462692.1 gliding motility-associated ABC transporter ATP-binding subunit GldA [Saprospiraceae bacterium]MCZ2337791.1 gliding motility-associated ABC transporter ATP-binding subunit GldA [Chitinophagales bacterium]
MSVTVKDLSKVYNDQTVVNHISFEARPGEILGFLGPNGAGKTTTMKMICCYTPPTSGSVTVNGFDILVSPLSVRKQIGYLPEHNPLYEEMYVKEFLQFVASIHKLENKNARISEVIEMTGLGKEQNKIIGTLSKGFRQRVGLAQAIIHNPDVLILDEPTSGLDMNQLIDIRALIKNLSKEKTVIFSSHIMQEVQALCDRVVIINNGQLVADESIEALSRKMVGEQQVIVRFEQGKIDISKYSDIRGVREIQFDHGLYLFSVLGETDIRPAIFHTAVDSGHVIVEMRQDKASIEDIFRKLTKSDMYA